MNLGFLAVGVNNGLTGDLFSAEGRVRGTAGSVRARRPICGRAVVTYESLAYSGEGERRPNNSREVKVDDKSAESTVRMLFTCADYDLQQGVLRL